MPAVSIGPQTSRRRAEAGVRVVAEAERHDLEGLVDASPLRSEDGCRPFITFLTDFGFADDLRGHVMAVMKRIAPEVEIIDITHGIAAQQVLQGALVLRNTLPYMPAGVHLAVVDPGVGTDRRAIALRNGDGRLYVGPDNGLLIPAAERMGGLAEAWELTEPEYRLAPISRTFHGRMCSRRRRRFSQGAWGPASLGPTVDLDTLERLDVPVAQVSASEIVARVLIVDRFGNVQLNLTASDLEQVGIVPSTRESSSRSGSSATTPSPRGPSLTWPAARSCSTRTRTGTSRSPSTSAMPPRSSRPAPATVCEFALVRKTSCR